MDFEARLDPLTYEDDVEVEITVASTSKSAIFSEKIAEQLYDRLVAIGIAYKLHYIGNFNTISVFSPAQIDGLLREISFLEKLMSKDAAVCVALQTIEAAANVCLRSDREANLTLELP